MRKLYRAGSHSIGFEEINSADFAAVAMFDRFYCVVGSFLLLCANSVSNSIPGS